MNKSPKKSSESKWWILKKIDQIPAWKVVIFSILVWIPMGSKIYTSESFSKLRFEKELQNGRLLNKSDFPNSYDIWDNTYDFAEIQQKYIAQISEKELKYNRESGLLKMILDTSKNPYLWSVEWQQVLNNDLEILVAYMDEMWIRNFSDIQKFALILWEDKCYKKNDTQYPIPPSLVLYHLENDIYPITDCDGMAHTIFLMIWLLNLIDEIENFDAFIIDYDHVDWVSPWHQNVGWIKYDNNWVIESSWIIDPTLKYPLRELSYTNEIEKQSLLKVVNKFHLHEFKFIVSN